MNALRRYWPYLVLALAPLFPLWRCVFLGETIGAWSDIRQMAPWNGPTSPLPWDVLQADSVLQFYGWRDMVFHAWAHFQLPFWNHYALGGTPLLANSQSGALYLPHILVGLLRLPTGLGITLLAWLHLSWAGVGVFRLCRQYGAEMVGATLGGLSFSLSAFMLAWTALPSVIETVAWIPWCLWALSQVILGPTPFRFARLGACVAAMFLAGHLQFAAYGVIGCAVIAVVAAAFPFKGSIRSYKPLLYCIVGLAIGGALAAPQLLPVLLYGQHSHRKNNPTWEGYQGYAAGALPTYEAPALIDPIWLGSPTSHQPDGGQHSRFWPAYVQRGGNFAESAIGVTPFVFFLIAMGLTRLRLSIMRRMSALAVVGLLLASGTPLCAFLYFLIPGWSATGSPNRAGVLFTIALSVMFGFSFRESRSFQESKYPHGLRIVLPFVVFIACYAVMAYTPLDSWIPGMSIDDVRHVSSPFVAIIVGALCAFAGVYAHFTKPGEAKNRYFGYVIIAAALGVTGQIRSGSPMPDPAMNVPADQRIAVVNGPWDLLSPSPAVLPPNTAYLLGIHELGGYDSIVDVRTRDVIGLIDGEDPAPAANGNMMFIKKHFDLAKLVDAGVSEVWSSRPLTQFTNTPEPIQGVYRYPVSGPGRVSGGKIVSETPASLTIEGTGRGAIVVRDFLREGWTATLNDAPVEIDTKGWPTVQSVAAGPNRVTFSYVPPGFTAGCELAALTVLLLSGWGFSKKHRKIEEARSPDEPDHSPTN